MNLISIIIDVLLCAGVVYCLANLNALNNLIKDLAEILHNELKEEDERNDN